MCVCAAMHVGVCARWGECACGSVRAGSVCACACVTVTGSHATLPHLHHFFASLCRTEEIIFDIFALLAAMLLNAAIISSFSSAITAMRCRRAEPDPSAGSGRVAGIHAFDEASAAYNIPMGLELEGSISTEAMRSALRRLISRHSVLRTKFSQHEDGTFVQAVGHVSNNAFSRTSSTSLGCISMNFSTSAIPR